MKILQEVQDIALDILEFELTRIDSPEDSVPPPV
jgi:hypothetical protein